MLITGLQKTSLVDFPNKIAAVIFTSSCNFYCGFCHNPELVDPNQKLPEIPEQEILEFLEKRKKILDGVVITGGEPIIYNDLPEFIKKIKKLGLLIKLDTNGTNPEMTKKLLTNKLISYIAMDIKGPLSKYEKITNRSVDLEKIKKSVDLIKKSGIDYEFRTTVVPTLLKKKDFQEIGKWLKGSKNYYLQQFRNQKTLDPKLKNVQPYLEEKLYEFAKIMKKYVKNVAVRGI